MRILYLTNFYPPTVFGGYELRCADVVEGLAARGHEAIVVTSRHGSGVRSVEGHVHRVLRSFWDLPEKPADQPGYLWALLEDNLVLERLVRSFRPDVISVWNMLGLSYTLARSVQESGVPALFHVDDTWLLREDEYWGHYGNPGPGTVKQTLGPELAGLVRKGRPRDHHPDCVFISGYRRDNHVDAGMAQQDAPVVYGGIEPDRFDTGGARPDGSSDTLRLLFAGAWTEAKGAEIPIRAMGLLPEAVRSRVRVTYVGKGPAGAHAGLETLAAALGIQDSVIFQGPVERDAMPGVYAAHDAFLFTASGPEGFPLVLLEAMASGLAVVSTADGGHSEYLRDRDNAFVVPKDDPAAVAERIASMLDDPASASAMAAQGRELVRERFTVEAMLDGTEAVLEKTARGGGG
ncbi:glycosyltransferase family 4 protein [Salidesulfovibrio brasiliensis]